MITRKFKVDQLQTTKSGEYAIHNSKDGLVWHRNRNYKIGDEVTEIYIDGLWNDPQTIIVNGIKRQML